MYCEVCGGLGTHRNGCPEGYERKRVKHICAECSEGIYADDEYVENENGDKIHFDCCFNLTTRQLVEWLGFDIKRMKDYD